MSTSWLVTLIVFTSLTNLIVAFKCPSGAGFLSSICDSFQQSLGPINFSKSPQCTEDDDDIGKFCITDSNRDYCHGLRKINCHTPVNPGDAQISVSLYNSDNHDVHFKNWRTAGVELSDKLTSGRIFFLVSGFLTDEDNDEKVPLRNAILEKYPNDNVLILNWYSLNKSLLTPQNVRLVGAVQAFIIFRASIANRTNIIGHSFGCHVAGEAGKVLRTKYNQILDEITGLDCAGPFFEGTSTVVKFDKSDARLTIAYHTDDDHSPIAIPSGYGNPEANAATDVFFSRTSGVFGVRSCGTDQPGCLPLANHCNHVRAWHYLISAIHNEQRPDCRLIRASKLIGSSGFGCTGRTDSSIQIRLPAFGQQKPRGKFFVQPGRIAPDYC